MTTIRSASELPMEYGTVRRGVTFPDDLRVVCLWSALGLTLTGLFCALGFAAEIAQAIAAAG